MTNDNPAFHKLSRRTFTAGVLSAAALGHDVVKAAGSLLNPAATRTDKLVIYQIFTRLFGNQNKHQ